MGTVLHKGNCKKASNVIGSITAYHVRANGAVEVTTVRQKSYGLQLRQISPTRRQTYKLITITMDTLRLEDPSTLFETQALGTVRREELLKLNRTHMVLAMGKNIDQVRAMLCRVLSTHGRLGRFRWKG